VPSVPSPQTIGILNGAQPGQPMPMPVPMPPMPPPMNGNGAGNGNGAPAEEPKAEEKKEEEKPAPPEPWALMRLLKGTAFGDRLDARRITISGWTEGSYTPSQAKVSNSPVVWNDRADKFLLNQLWLRAEKGFDTDSKEMSFGWRMDLLYGTDYRFTIPRGLWNEQLLNSKGQQNLYGLDPIQHYIAAYLPNLFKGTEVRVGRIFTPFGYESLEGANTPFVSRSYAFNWSPPFTHYGIMVAPQFNDNWSGKFMLANGNDVMIGDKSEELRFVGAISWTSTDKKTGITFGTSIGRGSFNAGDPFNPSTVGLQSEPAGRNNINVFDIVATRQITEKLSYAFEAIYGYQNGVPANVPGGIIATNKVSGTAHWGSLVNYLNYDFTEKVRGIVRVETFDDFEGQRTGFEGLYTAVTAGFQIKPCKAVMFRPEIRYDYNNVSRPFEGRHGLLTVGLDMVVRW
jgi:Putative beta-barrel porin-2, OmpL-like. bbp2